MSLAPHESSCGCQPRQTALIPSGNLCRIQLRREAGVLLKCRDREPPGDYLPRRGRARTLDRRFDLRPRDNYAAHKGGDATQADARRVITTEALFLDLDSENMDFGIFKLVMECEG